MEADDSIKEVARVPSALHEFNDRLHAGVELVGRNKEAIRDLTDQVQRIRQRAAENINLGSSLPQIHVELPSLTWADNKYLRDDPSYGAHVSRVDVSSPRHRQRNRSTGRGPTTHWSPDTLPTRHRSTPRLDYSNDDDREEIEALYSRLKSELMKTSTLEEMNEMLREENDAALQANEGLRSDVAGLTRALESLETQSRSDRQRFQAENTRYTNQLENQHRQLINLWKAFTAVKRQVRELHTSTANDLDRQKTEFARCAAMMHRAIKQAEHKNQLVRDEHKREKDDVVDEVMKKYDAIHATCMKTEHDLHEKGRQLAKMEHELKRVKEEKNDLENSLQKIDSMPELTIGRRRSRSVSPSTVDAPDIMRKIRTALSGQKEILRQTEEAKDKAEADGRRLKKEFEHLEKDLKEKRDISRQRNETNELKEIKIKELEGELRRLNDRLTMMAEEKDLREKTLAQLQDSITNMHRTHKEFIEELTTRHREELDSRETQHLAELEDRSRDLGEKENKMETEMEKLRKELDEARDKWREARADQATQKRIVDEKELAVLNLEEDINRLKKRFEEEANRADEHAHATAELNGRIEDQLAKETEIRTQLAESNNLNSVLNDEMKLLQEQMTELRNELSDTNDRIEQYSQTEQEYKDQLIQRQKDAQEMEDAIRNLKSNLQDLEIKLEGTMEEARISRDELLGNRNLLETKVQELNETIRGLEETKRDKEILNDDLVSAKRNSDLQNDQINRLDAEFNKLKDEDNKNRALLDDLRLNYDKLVNEIQEKKITIEDLKETIESMKAEEKKREEEWKAERLRDDEMNKLKEREMEDEWRARIDRISDEKKKAMEELTAIEGSLKDLTAIHEKLMEEELQLRMQLDEAKEATEEAITKHKRDVSNLESQNNLDREEWDKEREQLEKGKNNQLQQLKEELSKAEEDLKETATREGKLKIELDEIKEVLEKIEEEKRSAQREQEIKLEDERTKEQRMEDEKRAHNVRIEELHVKLTRANAQTEEIERAKTALERKLVKMENSLTKKVEDLTHLEEKISSLNDKMAEIRLEEIATRDRLVLLERENDDLKMAKDRVSSKLNEEQKRASELEEKLRELNRETQGARVQAQKEKEHRIGGDEKISTLTSRVKQLEVQLADRHAKMDSTSELLRKVEGDGASMAQALRNEKEKASDLQRAKEDLERHVKRLTEELEQTRVALERKTATSKQATTDLLSNYRETDRRLVEAQTECEQLKQQLTTLSGRTERAEAKYKEAERRLEDNATRQAELTRRLHHYEQSAKMALHMAKSNTDLRPGVSYVDIPRAGSSGIGESLPRANSSHNVSFFDQPRTFEDVRDLDLSSSMEITLRYLKERIVQLERDKAALNSETEMHKQDAKRSQEKLRDAANILRDVERKLADLATEKEQLEQRLISQRQLYLTTEEASRGRDSDYKTLRGKLATTEIHLREKESRIAHLATQLEATKLELASVDCDREKLAAGVKSREEQIRKLEDSRKNFEDEHHKMQKTIREISEDFKLATKRLEDTDSERIQLGKELEDVQRAARRDRDLLEKLQTDERHWRMTAVNAKKSSEEYHKSIYEERIANLQASYDAAVARNNATANDAEKLRQELREYSQKINTLNLKVADVERKAAAEKEGKATLAQQLAAFQRVENDWNKLEKEMREELKTLRKDKLTMTSEIEDLRRRITKVEIEKKEIEASRTRLDREVAVLRKHMQTLEDEKTRTEQAVKDTLTERKAIDKSIAAMERENAELYKNCGQLQTQIQQLEKDSGQRAVAKLLKEQALMEAKLAKLIQEKRHLELLIEQKESNYSHKKKLLESQLSLLRDQLEAERRRRLGGGSGRFERATDVRVSRTTSVRKDPKGPFREEEILLIEEIRSHSSSTLTNDTSLSIETTL